MNREQANEADDNDQPSLTEFFTIPSGQYNDSSLSM
jgi:hypothetical protein